MAAMLLAGCASSQVLTKQDRESLRAVSVSKDVTLPDDIVFYGATQNMAGALGGPIGAVVGLGLAESPKAKIKAVMKDAQIDVAQLVREYFETELSGAGIFPSVLPERGDAEFRLRVGSVGLWQHHPFSADLKPILGVKGTLVRPDGKVLWTKSEYVSALSDQTPAHSFDDYLKPETLREALAAAAKAVTDALVTHIRESSKGDSPGVGAYRLIS